MEKTYPLSYWAKFKYLIKHILAFGIMSFFVALAYQSITESNPFWIYILAFVIVIFNYLNYTHQKLVIDDSGVYQMGGFMPWNNGIRGLDWKEIEHAYFYDNFFSWSFQSYSISLKRRFSDNSVFFNDIHRGKKAVSDINDILQQRQEEQNVEQFTIMRGDE